MKDLIGRNISPHQQLAEIYADRTHPETRREVLKFVFLDIFKILGIDLIQILNQEAMEKNESSFILDIGCGRMGVGKALQQEFGLNEEIKWVGIDINDYRQKPTPPYSEVIIGDITSEETLNYLREKFGNEKIPAIFGIGLPPEIVRELIERKSDALTALLDKGGIILFVVDSDLKPNPKHPEFKVFTGKYPVDQTIIYYQKATSIKEE